jgi:hypothetical protein
MLGWILLFFLMALAAAGVGATVLDPFSATVAGGGCGIFSALGLLGIGLIWLRNH